MQRYINHNGKLLPDDHPIIGVDNRAFRYGWGLFETMLIRDGSVRLGDYHWKRLLNDAEKLGIALPTLMDAAYLDEEVIKTVKKNKLEKLARVRLQLYNGNGGLWDKSEQKAGYVIECFAIDEAVTELNENGLTLGISTKVRKAVDSLANMKTCSALLYAVAAEEAKANKWNDALVRNTDGNIIESTIANIFWVKDGTVYTTPLSEGCVAGVMRAHLMNYLPHSGIIVKQAPLSQIVLENADEIFLTNAIKGMRWVHSIEEQVFVKDVISDVYTKVIKVL